ASLPRPQTPATTPRRIANAGSAAASCRTNEEIVAGYIGGECCDARSGAPCVATAQSRRPRGEPRGLPGRGRLPAGAQHQRVAAVVLEPRAVVQRLVDEAVPTVAARTHQQLGDAVGEVVGLQADLDVVVDVVEERAVQLAV